MGDGGGLAGVYLKSAAAGAVLALLLAIVARPGIAVGFVLGLATAIASLALLELVVRALVRREGFLAGRLRLAGFLGLLKFAAIGCLIYWIAGRPWISLGAFVGGIAVPQAVFLVEAIRSYLKEQAEDAKKHQEVAESPVQPKET